MCNRSALLEVWMRDRSVLHEAAEAKQKRITSSRALDWFQYCSIHDDIYIYTYIHIYTYIYVYIYIHMHVYKFTYVLYINKYEYKYT